MLAPRRSHLNVGGLCFDDSLERVPAPGELLGGQACVGNAQAETEQPHPQDPKGPAAKLSMAAKHERLIQEFKQVCTFQATARLRIVKGADRADDHAHAGSPASTDPASHRRAAPDFIQSAWTTPASTATSETVS